jgi:beta-lactam-binding protein with PASTA domain
VTPSRVAIPKVRGLVRSDAKAKLVAAGLKVSSNDLFANNPYVRKGLAINTYPSYLLPDGRARKVAPGTVVRIRLSKGP